MENTVENNNMQEAVQDDAVLEPMQEQEEQNLSSLDEITEPEKEQQETDAQNDQEPQNQPQQKEPGYIRKKVDAAVDRAIRETEDRMRAEFAAQLAPLRESMYERQAEALVASGEIKSKEMALKYVKAMAGVQTEPDQQAKAQPRNDKGQFTSAKAQEADAEIKARARILSNQADKIKATRGLDVSALYDTDPDVKNKILSGEWDFYDVAEMMSQPKRRVPSPVRSSNSSMPVDSMADAIMSMSDKQFAALNENLAKGKVYDMRK